MSRISSTRLRPTPIPVSRALRELAANVGSWRRILGLTQVQLAERADVSVDTVASLESGRAGVSIENAMRIMWALGILERVAAATDPYETDLGKARADEHLPRRVRHRPHRG